MKKGIMRCKNAGFTLTEMLVTLGIIVLLLSVAIPSVFALQKSLKMSELDACARQIFLAAQNSLTGARSGGVLDRFQTLGASALSEGVPEGARYVQHMSGEDPSLLLPEGAIDPEVAQQHYLIIFNPSSGTVLAAFYAEHDFTAADAFLYNNEEQAKSRRSAQIGYYAGEDIEPITVDELSLSAPDISVTNNETMSVVVMISTPELRDKVELTVTVQSATDSSQVQIFTAGEGSFSAIDSLGIATLTLDTLPGAPKPVHFRNLVDSNFPYNEDILISASIAPAEKDNESLESFVSNAVKSNALFSKKAGAVVDIAYARHLQNLHTNYSNLLDAAADTNHAGIIVMQTHDILWPSDVGSYQPPLAYSMAAYNGGGNKIEKLKIENREDGSFNGAGVFGAIIGGESVNNVVFSNLRLVDPLFRFSGNIGGLAGVAVKASFTNCFVSIEDTSHANLYGINGHGFVGGLVGSASDITITDCAVGLPSLVNTASAAPSATGGLVGVISSGTLDNMAIKNSYAAIDRLTNSAIQTGPIAMLVGHCSTKITVANCYAVGSIFTNPTNTQVSGFLGSYTSDIALQNSYAATVFYDAAGKLLSLPNAPGFASTGQFSNCFYWQPSESVTTDPAGVKRLTYAELCSQKMQNNAFTMLTAAQTSPYETSLSGKSYPFPGLHRSSDSASVLPHYGNWPAAIATVPSASTPALVYYETYVDETNLGLYGCNVKNESIDTLRGNDVTVRTAGYAVMLPTNQSILSIGDIYLSNTQQVLDAPFSGRLEREAVLNEQTYYLYPFSPETIARILEEEQHINNERAPKLLFNGGSVSFWIQPRFGAAVSPDNIPLGTKTRPFHIRTQAQLAQIQDYRNRAATFVQSHDIPMNASWKPIVFPAQNTLAGSWKGISSKISDLPAPLFEEIEPNDSTKIRDLTIVNANVQLTSTSANGSGILVNTNHGNISGCLIMDSKITLAGSGFVAGFVGTNENDRDIANCTLINVKVTSGGGAAGFAVQNHGRLTNCRTRAGQSYSQNSISSKNGKAAGFVYTNSSGGVIKRCAATGTVKDLSGGGAGAAGFVVNNDKMGFVFQSYANCIVTSSNSDASGFVQQNSHLIQNCYAISPQVNGSVASCGFTAMGNPGQIANSFVNCYAATVLSGGAQRYGFSAEASNAAGIQNCYFYTQGENAQDSGAGVSMRYAEMTDGTLAQKLLSMHSDAWAKTNSPQVCYPYASQLAGMANPFPMLAGVDHYGDWLLPVE